MATIIQKRKLYYVVYYYTDEKGNRKQHWEPFQKYADAKKKKIEIEYKQNTQTFLPPSIKTIRELLDEFTEYYGKEKWSLSTYRSKKGLMNNYILPYIGDMLLEKATPRAMNQYYNKLKTTKAVVVNGHEDKDEYISSRNIQEIHKILNCAFKMAVSWEYIVKNPVENIVLPKVTKKNRAVWTVETFFEALSFCNDDRLALCMNLSFACSMRIGEILGLTWDCVDITEESITTLNTSLKIEKQLTRVSTEALDTLSQNEVIKIFPSLMSSKRTSLVLKRPKTESSIRRVWIPTTITQLLMAAKKEQQELKKILGDDYIDYNLVISQTNGRPVEHKIIGKAFRKLIVDHDLPLVEFHSLRHTSTTYKLKLFHGDIKAVQGDTGHSQASMVLDVYSHIIDGDRRKNAIQFDEAYYQPYMEKSLCKQEKNQKDEDKEKVLEILKQSPEILDQILKELKKN